MTKFTQKSFSVLPGSKASQERWDRTFGKTAACPDRPPAPKAGVAISGVWLRTREEETPSIVKDRTVKWTIVEVLVEVAGKWRKVQTHRVQSIDQTISHITEPAGIEQAPEDVL